MAQSNPSAEHGAEIYKENAEPTQLSTKDTQDEDTIALRYAQKELLVAYESLEQLLDVMRRADKEQLQSLFAATQSGLPRSEILAMVKQYAKSIEESSPK
ncbi:hypothetical protein UA08_05162 [Talaromyces atroroseus]|uniref:Uncharacterized protein n=1 Tax=Talaromyces atroroseus TaxID=1441469 RepID=A0A225ADS5_TALAT|nr:hypothetical protein UA08_05162 [Talaromyces atroroseus]OKL59341.1 hypothetical protein UA08_05162 [Talaromyces atroroseus]